MALRAISGTVRTRDAYLTRNGRGSLPCSRTGVTIRCGPAGAASRLGATTSTVGTAAIASPSLSSLPGSPARVALTCKVPVDLAALLKRYAEFLDSTQEYIVVETLRLAFHRDKEFQTWLAATPSDTPDAEQTTIERPSLTTGIHPSARLERGRS